MHLNPKPAAAAAAAAAAAVAAAAVAAADFPPVSAYGLRQRVAPSAVTQSQNCYVSAVEGLSPTANIMRKGGHRHVMNIAAVRVSRT